MNPYMWLAGLVGAITLAGASFLAGIKVESNHRDAQQLVLERAATEQYVKDVGKQRARADALGSRLAQAQVAREAARRQFKEELANAKRLVHVACPAQGSEVAAGERPGMDTPADSRIFTDEFVGLWNRALLGPEASRSGDPGATDGAGRTASAVEVLDNLEENANLCNGFRERLRAWQQLAIDNGWVSR